MSEDLTLAELHALPDNSLLNATQAARLLGTSNATFSRMLQDGTLEDSRIQLRAGGSPRFAKGMLLASLIARIANKPTSTAREAHKPATSAWPASAAR